MEFLPYVSLAVLFAAALLMGVLVPLLLIQLCRNVGFGIGLGALLFAFETFFRGFEGFQLGIRVSVPDIVSILMGAAVVLRLLLFPEARSKLVVWHAFVFSVLISLGIGLASFGTSGGVAARPYFYAIVMGSYALSFRGDERMVRHLLSCLASLSSMLVLVVFARWIITYVPIPSLLPPGGRFSFDEASMLRVVTSYEAMAMAQVAVVALFYPLAAPAVRRLRLLLPALFVVVLALQHRSVWLATLAATGARFALPQAGRKASIQLLAMTVLLGAVIVPAVMSGRVGDAGQDIARSADRAVAMTGTARARLDSWDFMVGKWMAGGPRAILLGLPMGTSAERTLINDRREQIKVNFQAHNFYVQTLFNTGILGIGAILWVYGFVLVWLYRGLGDSQLGSVSGAMLLLTVAQVVYYLPYGIDYLQGLILGVASALALSLFDKRVAERQAQTSRAAPTATDSGVASQGQSRMLP
jgi:hypothetical protein